MATNPRYRSRPPGTTSRLHVGKGPRRAWISPEGVRITFPLVLDLVHVDPRTRRVLWSVEATLDVIRHEPRLVEIVVRGKLGLDPVYLQKFFRWATPIDIVKRTIPQLIGAGIDPYAHDYAPDGYPDSADIRSARINRHSDEFLAEIAREYLAIGRGYADQIAAQRGVSRRTVVAWIEKARRRGILTRAGFGRFGGKLVESKEHRGKG